MSFNNLQKGIDNGRSPFCPPCDRQLSLRNWRLNGTVDNPGLRQRTQFGRAPLIGVIPLEALGLELDLQKQSLKVLPSESWDTYLTIL